MKRKILYIAAILICLSIITSGTLAYYTATDTVRNVITSGGVDIKVIEQQFINGTFQPFPEGPIPVLPSTTISKIVSVQSIEQAAWVRMRYNCTVYDSDDKIMEIPVDELNKAILIQPDNTCWTQHDGWWYYNSTVKAGEATTPLFNEVTFSGKHMDNKYQLCKLVIDVTAQAVQHANNGATVMEALGWPET